MDIQKVRGILSLYKEHFVNIHDQEIYKWRVVKWFQDHWNVAASDFHEMLEQSLKRSKNLLTSGQYYPKRMLLGNAEQNPGEIRQLFLNLYNEERDFIDRLVEFKAGISEINKINYPDTNDFQDHRAVMAYLSLRYPDRYYLYKFEMFRDFVNLVDYPYRPIKGRVENITQYLTLCNLLRNEILNDPELLALHKTRINETEFPDESYHILTQDVIYAATFHLPRFIQAGGERVLPSRLQKVTNKWVPQTAPVVLKGSFTNYVENARENKRTGDLGELLVLQHEIEKLKGLGINKTPIHKSVSEGDGLGYDILSYDENGKEIYIEVKTTTGHCERAFYVTRNELYRSKQDSDRFYLYRLFDFDPLNKTAKYFEMVGDLSSLCTEPVLFSVAVREDATVDANK